MSLKTEIFVTWSRQFLIAVKSVHSAAVFRKLSGSFYQSFNSGFIYIWIEQNPFTRVETGQSLV